MRVSRRGRTAARRFPHRRRAARRADARGSSGVSLAMLSASSKKAKPLEIADADVAVAEAGQHRRAGRRGLVAAPQLLAGFEQGEGLRRVDARAPRASRSPAPRARRPSASAGRRRGGCTASARCPWCRGRAGGRGRRAAGRTGSRARRRYRGCTPGTGGRDSAAPAAAGGCRAAARTGRNAAPSSIIEFAEPDPLGPAAVEEARDCTAGNRPAEPHRRKCRQAPGSEFGTGCGAAIGPR